MTDVTMIGLTAGGVNVLDDAIMPYPDGIGARACEAEGPGVDVFASVLPSDDPAAHLPGPSTSRNTTIRRNT